MWHLKISTIILFAVNLVGLAVFLYFVESTYQLALMEQRDTYDAFDSVSFIFTGFPAFLLCVLVDVIWSIVALTAFVRRRDSEPAVACGLAVAVWVSAIVFERHHNILPPHTAIELTGPKSLCVVE